MEERFDVARYGGNKETYLCMETAKAGDPDFEGLILDTDNYEDKINHIGIPHGRSKNAAEALPEVEQATLQSELWKLMRIARTARPGAICDASAADRTFTEVGIGDSEMELGRFRIRRKKKRNVGK